MNTTQPSDISRRKRKKAVAVPIGAVMQYARRAGQQSDVAVVRVVAESRTGWFVVGVPLFSVQKVTVGD